MARPAPAGYRGAWRDDAEACAVYSEAAGIGRQQPVAVARPAGADDVTVLLRWARTHGTSIVPRGSGSSMAGGAIGDGLVVDLGALDSIGVVDARHLRIRVGPGAIRDAVDAAARRAGLRFPVDPSSGAFCSIGGMVATNAAGARSLAFGAMRASVVALDCIFADGSRAELRRGVDWRPIPALQPLAEAMGHLRTLGATGAFGPPGLRKQSSGYALDEFLASDDVIDLLVGSEGTLCIVVGVELSLRPAAQATLSVLAAFRSLDAAVAAAVEARDAGATACELLDRTFLDMARAGGSGHGIPHDAEAVLLAEAEASDTAAAQDAAGALAAWFTARGAASVATARGPVAEAELWELRHAASPSIARLHPGLRSMQFIEDGAVPSSQFASYIRGIRDALQRHGLPGVIFGHAGDAHAHVNPLVDVQDPEWRAHVEGLLDDVTTLVATLGGTLAAEHGDGRVRTPLLDRVWSPRACDAFALVKRLLDPDALLNPGVKVPLPGQQPLAAIKYDPQLPALPPRAQHVLHHVEQQRAYARSRLALLDETAPPSALPAAPPTC